jgi:hypothetical protein
MSTDTLDEAPSEHQRRGRPPGIKLGVDQRRLLIAAVEAGASDHAAGIDPRTFRDWRSRAEGRQPNRKATPEIIQLFREIDEAAARARVTREINVADRDPKHWLRYQARSKPGLDGWTEPVPEEPGHAVSIYVPSTEEFLATVRALGEALVEPRPRHCGDSDCRCSQHEEVPHEDG